MTPFDRALAFVLAHEGGDVDDPHDPGGRTRFGISQRAYPREDIGALTRERAAELYRRDYWTPLHCDDLAWPVALALFDTAVNCGVQRAIRLAQRAVGVPEDGLYGPQTRAALQVAPQGAATRLLAQRACHYASLPTVGRFGVGWFLRVLDCAREGAA